VVPNLIMDRLIYAVLWQRMRDLSSLTWVIPRFLGKRVIKGTLSIVVVFRNTL
jgi:hypothetical protein